MTTDILVLGTGVSARQTIRYLQGHPDRASFTFAIAGRSKAKLNALVNELSLPKDVLVHIVDVQNEEQVQAVVNTTRVVLNTVGPYWLYGTPVVKACIRAGKHYTDLTGEASWLRKIINEHDYSATKTGSIIVPCCGMDCIPSDITTYLGRKTIASTDPNGFVPIGQSTMASRMSGTMSGGSAATLVTAFETVPYNDRRWSQMSHALSPIVGIPRSPFKLFYSLTIPYTDRTLVGGIHVMAGVDRAIVERSWGLLEYDAISSKTKEAERARYGPEFTYDEFMVMPSRLKAYTLSLGLFLSVICLWIPPLRYVFKKFVLPEAGAGPTDANVHKGFLDIVNVTNSASKDLQAVTTFKAKGDPGYYLSCIMISECALALLHPEKLPELAQRGGILTTATAFGDVLVDRLNKTGKFEIVSFLAGSQDGKRIY